MVRRVRGGLVYALALLLLQQPDTYECATNNRLNEYISHHETLSYDTQPVHRDHQRVRRSAQQQHLHLDFRAHNRHFRLRLKRDLEVFGDGLEVHDAQGRSIEVDRSHIYRGHLAGEPNSVVFGSVMDGVFEGKIATAKDAYYVEKAHHYFPKSEYPDRDFHSVIYREDHVDVDPHADKPGHTAGCGVDDDVLQWMEGVQNSGEEEEVKQREFVRGKRSAFFGHQRGEEVVVEESGHGKYSREANERARRGARMENKNTCSLYIQTDPLIWKHIRESFPETTDQKEANEKTREEILSLIAHHVTAVNYIYYGTKFDGQSEHRDIKFEVQRIKIDDHSSCRCNGANCEINQFCMENIDVSNFLNIHSLGNHEHFCLAYVFTYRDFTGGTLGLAWVASASGASGGICEKYKTYTETIQGTYQSTKRSLNTGIITFVNYNSRVPPKVSQLTLAHEIGHNFDSPHDYRPECRPGGVNGNFIMFASATSGDRPNNSKFSACSIGNISNVLDAIEQKKKNNCFKASEGAFCGNKIVEVGEECDCGYDEAECRDKCCYPRIFSDEDRRLNASAAGCARRHGTQCSPSQGPCCSSQTCHYVQAYERRTCTAETECSKASRCDGTSSDCPPPAPKVDNTRCNNNTQLCHAGQCNASICREWNLQPCSLTSLDHPDIDKRKLCELACQNGTDICRSTSEFAHRLNLSRGGISLRPGSPCDNYQGYCDVFLKCRAVDADGPLVRLMNLLLSHENLLNAAQWITKYWWGALLMGIGFVIFMGLFIKCCAVHTPSSNPKKPPPLRITDTLRRPINTLRRMRHNPRGVPQGVQQGAAAPGRAQRTGQGGGGGDGRAARPAGGPRAGYGERRGHYNSKATAPASNYTGDGRGASGSQHHGAYAGAYDRSGSGAADAFEMRHKV